MSPQEKKPSDIMLTVTAYITLISVAIGTLFTLPPENSIWPVLGLFVLVGVVMFFQDKAQQHGYLWPYIITITILTSLFYFFGVAPGLYLIIYFIISAQAMMLLPGRWGIAWIILLGLISAITFTITEGLQTGLLLMLVYSGGYLFFGIFGRALMDAQIEREKSQRLYLELQAAHEQLQDYVYRVEELAVTQERNRLAREMHDSLGHRLTVAAVQLEGAQRLIPKDPDKAAEMVDTVRQQVRQSLSELRQTVAALRDPIETGLSIQQALERLVAGFEEGTGLVVHATLGSLPPLTDKLRLVLFRTVQEALTNVQRHAQATQVWLHLSHHFDAISLLVSDDGKGYPPDAERLGFGLRGIRERVAQVGGECHCELRQGGGAQLAVRLPLQITSAEDAHE